MDGGGRCKKEIESDIWAERRVDQKLRQKRKQTSEQNRRRRIKNVNMKTEKNIRR